MKDIVIEQDINPEVDKPSKRKQLDVGRGSRAGSQEKDAAPTIDWEQESTPLVPCGGAPKFLGGEDKHNVNEGETIFVTFKVEADPVPGPDQIEWIKGGAKDMSVFPRCKLFTDGSTNTVTMGIKECKAEDEGDFQCIVTNSQGAATFDFKVFVTVEGGMDFRAMLMKKKVKQKKVVVQKMEWIEPLFDMECQQGKDKQVVMTAKLCVAGMKGKWYQRNETIMADIKSGENGRECQKGDKYDFKQEGDTYTLTINNPVLEDDGTYILLVKEVDAKTSGYLTVKKRDPEYWFVRPLKEQELGYTNRPYSMSVELSEPGVNLKWLKNGAIINWSEVSCIKKDEGCISSIYFPNCVEDDTSYYSAIILEYVKNGEVDQTNCWFQVDEYPHTFTSKLKAVNCVEKDTVEFNIDTEAADAEVTWYIGNKKIVPDDKKIFVSGEGTKRKLVIKGVEMKDSGDITCKTNKDKSTANLHVGILNEITKAVTSDAYRSIAGMVFAVEREDVDLYVTVKDPDAPVYFYINGKKLDENNFRFEHTNNKGAHTFKIKRTELAEAGELEVRTPLNKDDKELTSCTTLDVMMGERKPTVGKIGKNNKVEAQAGKHCQFDVPFSVEGKKQSELSVKIMGNDGKELKDGQDINITMHDGKISVNVINPKRQKSGNFKIIVGNDQGSSEQDVDVNIMDKPATPGTCTVNNVFHDNCMVNFAPPDDDGGTEIVKYIIEEMNVTEGGGWSQVAEVGANEKKAKIEGLNSGDKYRFRVKAVNKLGESNPCEMKGGDICIKDPWGPPTAPGKPNILDWGPDFCDVSFAPPESDGGAKISHYQIEMRENKMTEFVKGKIFTAQEVREKQGMIHAKIPNLVEGYQYSFRVKAINLGSTGLWNYSPPSDPSATMTAKTRYAKASFKEPGMHDIEVKAGKTIRYDIWFQGEPEPDVTWEREGMGLASDDTGRVTIEHFVKNGIYCEKNSVLTVTKAERKTDSGMYKIRLSCGGGSTEATGHVNVIDVPTRPRGFQTDEVSTKHHRIMDLFRQNCHLGESGVLQTVLGSSRG